MQGWIRPQGEQGAGTYWWRRLVVVLIVAALGVSAWLVWAKGSGAKKPDAQPTAPAATPPAGTAPAQPTPPPASVPPTQAPATPAVDPNAACDPKILKLAVTVPPQITPGKDVPLTLSVSNGGTVPCQLALTPKTFALVLSRDKDIIWSSTDCDRRLGTLPKGTLTPGQASEWTSKWPGKKAGEGCALTDDILASGAYQFAATIVDGPSVQQRITIN